MFSPKKRRGNEICEVMYVLINSIEGILSQHIHISNDIVHFKHLTILFVNNTSVKMKKSLQFT